MAATQFPEIRKAAADLAVHSHLADYESVRRLFTWDTMRRELGVVAGGFVNIAYAAVDRHLPTPVGDRVALRFVSRNAAPRDVTYLELARRTNRFANVLRTLGVGRGDHVFVLAGRVPEFYTAVLGALKNGSVVIPCSSGLGMESVRARLAASEAGVLLTTEALYRTGVDEIASELRHLTHMLVAGENGTHTQLPGTVDLATRMERAVDTFDAVRTAADDVALLQFAGNEATLKAAIHVHGAAIAHYASGKYALDLHDHDVVWCTVDTATAAGLSYGILAPLLHGVRCIVDEAAFDAARAYRVLAGERVSVWCAAPTDVRVLMEAGAELARRHRLRALRFVASAGGPLDPATVGWGRDVLGRAIHEQWVQTETGSVVIANTVAQDIRPGSWGRPLPGVDACVVERSDGGGCRVIDAPGVEGELALGAGWPSMFHGYLHDEEHFGERFAGDLYLTGDRVRRDTDGHVWFVRRADDVLAGGAPARTLPPRERTAPCGRGLIG